MFLDHMTITASASVIGVLDQFNWHWQYAASQMIAFVIFALVLNKFAFRPVREVLEQRSRRIADGEEKLKLIEQQLAESEQRTKEALAEANAQATRMIEEAKESAAAIAEKKTQEAVHSAQRIIAKAEEAAKQERAEMLKELRAEFGRLVVATTAQVTGKVLDESDQKRLNQEAVSKLAS